MADDPIWLVLSDFPSKRNERKNELWLLEHGFYPYGTSLEAWYGRPPDTAREEDGRLVDVLHKGDNWMACMVERGRATVRSEPCETPEEAICGLYGKLYKEADHATDS